MSFVPVTEYLYDGYDPPPRVTHVKKMIWSDSDQKFNTTRFIRVQCDSVQQCLDTMDWCREQFGNQQYQGAWWADPANPRQVWLADHLATFWQLRWGGTT